MKEINALVMVIITTLCIVMMTSCTTIPNKQNGSSIRAHSSKENIPYFKVNPFDGEKISDKPISMIFPSETIVDNEDPGFEITSNESESFLKKWVLKEDENKLKYAGMNPWRPPTSWTLITNSDFYGEYVCSGYYLKI